MKGVLKMDKILFTDEAEKTLESVNAVLLERFGEAWYESLEEIEKDIKEGWLSFEDGVMTVYWA